MRGAPPAPALQCGGAGPLPLHPPRVRLVGRGVPHQGPREPGRHEPHVRGGDAHQPRLGQSHEPRGRQVQRQLDVGGQAPPRGRAHVGRLRGPPRRAPLPRRGRRRREGLALHGRRSGRGDRQGPRHSDPHLVRDLPRLDSDRDPGPEAAGPLDALAARPGPGLKEPPRRVRPRAGVRPDWERVAGPDPAGARGFGGLVRVRAVTARGPAGARGARPQRRRARGDLARDGLQRELRPGRGRGRRGRRYGRGPGGRVGGHGGALLRGGGHGARGGRRKLGRRPRPPHQRTRRPGGQGAGAHAGFPGGDFPLVRRGRGGPGFDARAPRRMGGHQFCARAPPENARLRRPGA
mmetsp:Transcript_35430/g.79944  ORF Transcript_35430/g.79944 Transcript_35430/m.79944 type:complete len:349 (+) Transcript_35430:731-1777(+)